LERALLTPSLRHLIERHDLNVRTIVKMLDQQKLLSRNFSPLFVIV